MLNCHKELYIGVQYTKMLVHLSDFMMVSDLLLSLLYTTQKVNKNNVFVWKEHVLHLENHFSCHVWHKQGIYTEELISKANKYRPYR